MERVNIQAVFLLKKKKEKRGRGRDEQAVFHHML